MHLDFLYACLFVFVLLVLSPSLLPVLLFSGCVRACVYIQAPTFSVSARRWLWSAGLCRPPRSRSWTDRLDRTRLDFVGITLPLNNLVYIPDQRLCS